MPVLELIDHRRLDKSITSFIESMPDLPLVQLAGTEQSTTACRMLLQQLQLEGTCPAAALWLLAGHWDRSHEISQDQHNSDGSYWHGILHRIEGDYWNSKYWLRQAKGHPVRVQLVKAITQRADQLIQSEKSSLGSSIPDLTVLNSPETVSEGLVDLVQKAVGKQTDFSRMVSQVCWWEWELLFQHSLTDRL